jgi:prepilin-type processing-associated H-X9-DG protein
LNIFELGVSPIQWSAKTKVDEIVNTSRFVVAGEAVGNGSSNVPYDRLSNYNLGSDSMGYYSPWPHHGNRTNTLRGDGHVEAVKAPISSADGAAARSFYTQGAGLKTINYADNPWSWDGKARNASSGVGNRQRKSD